MPRESLEINRIEDLAPLGRDWEDLLSQTPGASFFQSLPWLQVYWRHFGAGQKLRVLVVQGEDRPAGILPLVVRRENSKVGPLRVLTFPLHAWGSFYGPVGPDPAATLAAGLEHVRRTRRDWDVLELRWQGAVGADPQQTQRAMTAAGFQAYTTVWDRTAVVDLGRDVGGVLVVAERGLAAALPPRRTEALGARQAGLRPLPPAGGTQSVPKHGLRRALPLPDDDGSPRWDLYDACEELARRSWQAAATNGTTLSHQSVRGFLREVHQAAAQAGAVDLNLLLLDGSPVAFIYGYHYRGYVYGLRRGYDPERARRGRATCCWPTPCATASPAATASTTWASARWRASDTSRRG